MNASAMSAPGMIKAARNWSRSQRVRGRAAEAGGYLHEARKSYDWIFAADNSGRGSRIGWLPETAGTDFHESTANRPRRL